jgi:hypothetical protein
MALDPFAELRVLEPRARQHAYESPAAAVDVLHRLAGTELRVGHVEELGPAGGAAQRLPGLDMGRGIVGIARLTAKLHRHRAILGGGEDDQQLLEVRAVIFGVAMGNPRRTLAPQPPTSGLGVLAAELHRRGVVVQLRERQPKRIDRGHHHRGQQGRTVGIEQPIERSSYRIVA